jgi:putative transposase
MPYRKSGFAQGGIYHVYNRGIDGLPIFASAENYTYLLRKIKQLVQELALTMLAYCLMPTHYHFVLRQDGDEPISRFVQRLFGAYTQAYNRQKGRSGPLFEGRFRHVRVDRDEYAVHLCRYVHLNPIQAGLVDRPEQWVYSNYLEWIGGRPGTLIDTGFVRQYFKTAKDYVSFVHGKISPRMERLVQRYLLDD